MTLRALLISALLLPSSAALAASFKPCVVYTEAGKMDKSFNEMAYSGVQAFSEASGVAVQEFEPASPADYGRTLDAAVAAKCSDIMLIGFRFADDLAVFAPKHPQTHFSIIDGMVPGDNVASVLFAENEGSYLLGVAAALSSHSGKLGFVGGMAVPVVFRFQAGFAQGAKDTRPDTTVSAAMVADTPKGFADPFAGSEIARDMLGQGVDVVFSAAGVSGLGVLDVMAAADKLGAGVDSNQDYLYPGHVLSSMIKRVDVATQRIFTEGKNGQFKAGVTRLGLRDGAVDITLDDFNASLMISMRRYGPRKFAAP